MFLYLFWKKEIQLQSRIAAEVIDVRAAGVEFKTIGKIDGIKGFIFHKNIQEPNFNAVYRRADKISVKYTGYSDQHKSIYGMEIKKTN